MIVNILRHLDFCERACGARSRCRPILLTKLTDLKTEKNGGFRTDPLAKCRRYFIQVIIKSVSLAERNALKTILHLRVKKRETQREHKWFDLGFSWWAEVDSKQSRLLQPFILKGCSNTLHKRSNVFFIHLHI